MKAHDHTALFQALNEATDILQRNRTPDPEFIAAFDTLKQARAMLEKTLSQQQNAECREAPGLMAVA